MADGGAGGRVGAACPGEDRAPWLASRLAAPGSPARDRFYRTVSALGAQAARALDFAHRRNIVHRDIKPENLIISEEDGTLRLRVTDFGFSAPETGRTDGPDGVLMGTPSYMSPEQAIGLNVDRRSDIYSLGAVLYELATLEPVVRRGTLSETIQQIAFGKIRPPREIDRAFPPALEQVLLTALARMPEDRYSTASEFAEELERFSRGEMIRRRRLSLRQRVRLLVDHHSRVAPFVLLIVILLASVVLNVLVRHRESLDAQWVAARRAEARAEKERDRAEGELYAGRIALGQLAHERGLGDRLSRLLSLTSPRPGEPDRRGWEWYHLRSLDRKGAAVFAHRWTEVAAALHPGGTLLAISRGVEGTGGRPLGEEEPGLIEVRELRPGDVATASLRTRLDLPSPGPAVALAWSADGERLAAMNHRGEVVAWKFRSWQRIFERTGIGEREEKGLETASLAWSGDGSRLTAVRGSRVTTWTVPSGFLTLDARPGEAHYPFFARPISLASDATKFPILTYRSGDTVYLASASPSLDKIWLIETRDPFPADEVVVTAVSREGIYVAVARAKDSVVTVAELGTGKTVMSLRCPGDQISALAFGPGGELLATGDADGLVTIRETATGQERSRHLGRGRITQLDWSRDGKNLLAVSRDGTARVWDLEHASDMITIEGTLASWFRGPGGEALLGFSPDGRQFAALTQGPQEDGHATYRMSSWDAATGAPVVSVPWDGDRQARSVRWDGDRLVLEPTPGSPDALRDPEGRLIAAPSARIPGAVEIAEAGTGKVLRTLPGTGAHRPVGWSPDGGHLATRDGKATRIWDVRTGIASLMLSGPGFRAGVVDWSDNDSTVLVAPSAGCGPTRLFDASTGEELATLRDEGGLSFTTAAFQPGGHRIAAGALLGGMVTVFDARTGAPLLTLETGGQGPVDGVAWSPDGKKLAAYDGGGRRLVIWDATAGYEAGDLGSDE
jgi:WD40 repeat protein